MTAAKTTFRLAQQQLSIADRAVQASIDAENECRALETLLHTVLSAYGLYSAGEAAAFDMEDESSRKKAFGILRTKGPVFVTLFVRLGENLERRLEGHEDQHIELESPFRAALARMRGQLATIQQAEDLRAEMEPWDDAADASQMRAV